VTITEFLLEQIEADLNAECGGTGEYARCADFCDQADRHAEARRRIVELHLPTSEGYPARSYSDGAVPECCGICSGDGEYPKPGNWPCETLKLLALPYSDRAGYDKGWRL